jgi:hypothetical protein
MEILTSGPKCIFQEDNFCLSSEFLLYETKRWSEQHQNTAYRYSDHGAIFQPQT